MRAAAKGFTLAELLIAMVILGIIATFFIPQVLNAVGAQQHIAKTKDAIKLIESSVSDCTLAGTCSWATGNFYSYFVNPAGVAGIPKWIAISPAATIGYDSDKIALADLGPNPPASHACVTGTTGDTGWIILKSGQLIAGVNTPGDFSSGTLATRRHLICIDTNGGAGPNQVGTDIRVGTFELTTSGVAPTATAFNWGISATGIATNATGAGTNDFLLPTGVAFAAPFNAVPNAAGAVALAQ